MSDTNRKLIILAQSLEQPRVIKRIIEKSFEYDQLEVYGFNRGIHEVKNYEVLQHYDNVNTTVVGSLSNSQYLKRIGDYLRLISRIYKEHGFASKNIYVFGLDMRMISSFICNSRIDYEISDILWLYMPYYRKVFLRKIDLMLAKHSNKVIYTSQGFYDSYYAKFVKPTKVIIKENKFKTYGKVSPIKEIKKDNIRIAYIGAFRYGDIIRDLMNVVKQDKRLILNFYGDGFKVIVDEMRRNAAQCENIFFHGAFKNPDDLEGIYAENNINFVVYDNRLENEKVAMPNKYYESGFFNIPIIAAENTYVGKRVIEQGMGWVIGVEQDDFSAFFKALKMSEIMKYHEQIKALDKSLFEI